MSDDPAAKRGGATGAPFAGPADGYPVAGAMARQDNFQAD